ncbi:MAG TPA: plasmid stabilization protein [Cytophagales bacterium]|nr:plasmid stabilization protein [Cytophagales bacterium]
MKVEFLRSFAKDVDELTSSVVKQRITDLIRQVESASSIRQIPQIKKLKGFTSAYRIRVGDYRVGIFVTQGTVQFARVKNRKEIYRSFP